MAQGNNRSRMKTVEDYRQHAEECRQLASQARTPEERDLILNMAATWEKLARSRERTLKAAAKPT